MSNTHQSKPAYDADKVERLKRTLCSSLKHASNIRSIKGQQWVVLVVNAQASGNANFFGRGLVINGQGQSSGAGSLVIKANKGDIDRFAGQQMDLGGFSGAGRDEDFCSAVVLFKFGFKPASAGFFVAPCRFYPSKSMIPTDLWEPIERVVV